MQPEMCFDEPKVRALRAALPDPGCTRSLAEALKAAGHPVRLRILQLLAHEECCVCDVAHTLDEPVSTVSQHLQRLRRSGLVLSRKQGKWVYYRLSSSPVSHVVTNGGMQP